MQLITMQVLHSFTTFLLSALMSKLRIGGCLLALSLFQTISIHVVTAGWQLNQSWMAKMHPSTKATDLHRGICSSKYTQALLLKRFWLSRSKSLTGRPDEPNTWKIKLEVKTPTIGLSIATQMRKGLMADQHTATSPHSMQNRAWCGENRFAVIFASVKTKRELLFFSDAKMELI